MESLMFTRTAFWVFLLCVMVGLSFLQKKTAMRNLFLFVSSIFFYWNTSTLFVLLLLFSTVSDWIIGLVMDRTDGYKRKSMLILSIVINLGLLCFFKFKFFSTPTRANFLLINMVRFVPGPPIERAFW